MTAEERLDALERRVSALEGACSAAPGASGGDVGRAPTSASGPAPTTFWALEELRRQVAAHGLGGGAVLFTGTVETPGGAAEWQITRGVADLLGSRGDGDGGGDGGADDAGALEQPAAALAALGSPVRLQLLLAVLAGPADGVTTAELGRVPGVGTSGQVYHHLRQLVAAGWLRQLARGRYAVPPERVVPLLVALALAGR